MCRVYTHTIVVAVGVATVREGRRQEQVAAVSGWRGRGAAKHPTGALGQV